MPHTPATLDLPLTPPAGGQILYKSPRATIIWGDCRDPQVIAQAPAGYGLLCTDPPYGVAFKSGRGQNFEQIAGDDGTVDWPSVLGEWVGPEGTQSRGLRDKRHVYVFGYRPDQLARPLRLGGTAELVWDKLMSGMGDLTQPWAPQPRTHHIRSACKERRRTQEWRPLERTTTSRICTPLRTAERNGSHATLEREARPAHG